MRATPSDDGRSLTVTALTTVLQTMPGVLSRYGEHPDSTETPMNQRLFFSLALAFLAACGPAQHGGGGLRADAPLIARLPGEPPPGFPGGDSEEREDLWALMEDPAEVSAVDIAALRERAAGADRDHGVVLLAAADWLELAARRSPDPCDRAFASRQRQELRRISGIFEEHRRPDLAMFGRIQELVVDGSLVPEALADLAAWAEKPDHRWIRREALGRALGGLRDRLDQVDLLLTVPVCDFYFVDLLAEVEVDRGEGAHERNASRLFEAWIAAGACLDRSPVRLLTDRVVSAAATGDGGPIGALEALGGLAGQLALSALDGQAGDLPAVLGEVTEALRRLRAGLGNEREDRVLHATIGVFAGTAELFRGRAAEALQEIGTAADLLDHLAAEPVADDAPDLLRLAPALRGGSLAALALLQWITDQGGLAAGTLQRLDVTIQGDLSALFRYLDTRDHSAAITGIVRAVSKIVQNDWPAATAAMAAATPPGPGEEGWWAVGLDAGRMIAWDLLAILAWTEAPDVAKAALVQGEAVAQRLVDDALAFFRIRGTGWELLSVIPLAHQAVPALTEDDPDWNAVLKDLARAVEPALEQALARVPPPGDAPRGFTDLVVDVLRDATEVGLDTLVDQGKAALPRLTDLLDARQGDYTGEMRFFLGMLSAATRFANSPETAAPMFDITATEAPDSLAAVAWMPRLFEAILHLHVADDPAAALASLDAVLAHGERAASCNMDDPVHALLPARMWLREVTGDVSGATADYQAFRSRAARGFPGYATLACTLVSQRGGLIVNAQVSQSLAASFLPTGKEGAFNVGAGWSSVDRAVDDLGCTAFLAAGPRDDALLHAHLAAAMYAFRRGDDREAHRALGDALAVGRRLTHGDEVILGKAQEDVLAAARKAVALDLVAWVTFTARIRGHVSAADHLASQADWLLAQREETTWDVVLPEEATRPIFLARLPDLAPLGPYVRAWHLDVAPAARGKLLKVVAKDKALRKLLPRWGLRVVREFQEISAARDAGTREPALSKPPKDPIGGPVVDMWRWSLAATKDPAGFDLQAFTDRADALTAAGLHRETVGAAAYLLGILNAAGIADVGLAVLNVAADLIPRDTFPVARAAILGELAPVLMRAPNLLLALVAHQELVPGLTGRIATQAELEYRLNYVNLLGAAGMVPELTDEVRALVPMIERAYDRNQEVFHSLLSVDVALRILQGRHVPPDAALAALVATADHIQGALHAKQFLRLLLAAQGAPARSDLSSNYLKFMFQNGPSLEETTPGSGSPPPGR